MSTTCFNNIFLPTYFTKMKTFDSICSKMIKFDQIWSSLIKFDQAWSSLIQFDPIDPKVHDYSKNFIIVQKNKKNNNKVILRTLEVNSRGQKEKSNFYNSASAIQDSGMLQRSFTSLLKLILKFLDVFNHNFWNSVWPIILNGIEIFLCQSCISRNR